MKRRFNTQPPEGGWLSVPMPSAVIRSAFQHTAARRRLGRGSAQFLRALTVSTHSRPKAAGFAGAVVVVVDFKFQHTAARRRLDPIRRLRSAASCFNTQPPEGGWVVSVLLPIRPEVSTHSRPKAAGPAFSYVLQHCVVSTHSRPKAAGKRPPICDLCFGVSTHSRPKAAGVARYLL